MCANMRRVGATKLFDMLRDLALENGALSSARAVDRATAVCAHEPESDASAQRMKYSFLGHRVCKRAFAALLGCSWAPRLTTLLRAVLLGARSAPVDARYLQRPNADPTPVLAEVHSYLEGLYQSVAETLPLLKDKVAVEQEVWSGDECEWAKHTRHTLPAEDSEARYLPPGTMFDVYAQFLDTSGLKCAWSTFHRCWKQNFKRKLVFRDKYVFSVCGECVRHKMLIRHLAHDANERLKQRQLYEQHLRQQMKDRHLYWSLRASSRLKLKCLTIVVDGVDQAKFGIPRAHFFASKLLDKYHRPRLHVWGAIAHGTHGTADSER